MNRHYKRFIDEHMGDVAEVALKTFLLTVVLALVAVFIVIGPWYLAVLWGLSAVAHLISFIFTIKYVRSRLTDFLQSIEEAIDNDS